MLVCADLTRVLGVNQLYVMRNGARSLALLIAKLGGDFLIADRAEHIDQFLSNLQWRFVVDKITDGPNYQFRGCRVRQKSNADIIICMQAFWNRIKPLSMT